MKHRRISLRVLLILVFLGFSTLVVSTVMLSTNVLLKNEFVHYIDQSHSQDVQDVKKEVSLLLDTYSSIDQSFIQDMSRYVKKGFVVQIKDQETYIYDGFVSNSQEITQLHKEYESEEKKLRDYFEDNYAVFEGTLDGDNQNLDIIINIYRPYFINDHGFQHLDSLNQIFIYVGLITLAFAILLSFVLARMLVKPLQNMIEKFDLTKRGQYDKRISQDLRIIEYQQLVSSFNQLNQSLQNQKQLRKNVSADLSHELRTPLTAMSLTLENIQEGIWTFDEDIQKSLLEEVHYMQILINDIHKLEQIEATVYDLNCEYIDLKEMMTHVLTVFQSLMNDKELSVHTHLEKISLYADKSRMIQVMTNILSNAIKYSRKGGTIDINMMERKNDILISIKDNGIGIPKQDQKRIFERYYRSTKKESGRGIGLAVASEIVKAHEGDILLFSDVDKGTEVIVIMKKKNLH